MRRHVTGLHLMHLLIEAHLADFHARVEALSEADRASAYVGFPLKLETFLMEGGYNKILDAGKDQPSPLYAPFLEKLDSTVQDDIADCAAAAYPQLTVAAAVRMLRLADAGALGAYISRRGLDWRVEGGVVHFAPSGKAKAAVDASALMGNALHYATELERIV